jgi:cytochrome c-type biogenesis protein
VPFAAITLSPVGFATAFAAGFVSFVSPCVWPLVPAYLSYVSGVAYEDLAANARRVTLATLCFVAGFTIVFTGLGIGAAQFGGLFIDNRRTLEVIGGVLVIAMGLVLVGVGGRLFAREARVHLRSQPASLGGAVIAGMAFAVGWTPCIGPTLTAILAVAGTGNTSDAAALLIAYSLGLGVPFLLAGLFLSSTIATLGVLRRHAAWVNRVGGTVLILVGFLLATGQLTEITRQLSTTWAIG